MALPTTRGEARPWWVRSRAPWSGAIFQQMALPADSPEERRVQTIREGLLRLHGGKRRISIAKALIVTRTHRDTEGLHPALRRARIVERVFHEIPIALMPGQLLLGVAASAPRSVEFDPTFLRPPLRPGAEEQPQFSPVEAAVRTGIYFVEPADRRVFDDEIWPYWQTRGRPFYVANELREHYPETWRFMRCGDCYEPLSGGALGHTVQDYASIISRGLNAIKAEIRAQIAALDAGHPQRMDDFERRDHYEAMLIVADAIVAYARRNAALAEQLAAAETDPERAVELREMARIARKVPAEPAETWWEALQAFHFLRLGTPLAEDADSHSAGRFDQYMYPYLQRDLAAGRLTKARAQELLECFFLKWNETHNFKYGENTLGVNNNDKITIGGVDGRGRDATNDLTYMLLEAHAHVHLNDPNLSLRLHRDTPDDLLRSALEVVRLGGGLPILISDEAIVPALAGTCGVALEHARNYADLGCQENVVDPNTSGADTNGRNNAGWFNLPKPIELALHDGVNPLNGLQVGPRTGDPRTFATMEQLLAAVQAQFEHAVRMNVIENNVSDYVYARYFPCVYHNLLHPGPRSTGVDINAGGCRYNWTGGLGVGLANAGDILSAIDELVFRRREVTWDELLGALERDWEGAAPLHRRCLAAPKYGCDDERADGWARWVLETWDEAYGRYPTPRGGRFVCGLISMGTYATLGRRLGATADGRRHAERLADAASPSIHAPARGPTATHLSAARGIDTFRTPNGVTFNQRFNATTIATPSDLSKWAGLVRAYVNAGGQQVQYTVVDRETLLAAREHPEEYRDLFVRVGGYSAVFVDLSRDVQDSIIARTEAGL